MKITPVLINTVQQALQQLHAFSADDETRRLAFVRERALRDEISALQDARDEGRQEGLHTVLECRWVSALVRCPPKPASGDPDHACATGILG